jgi:hypothetical protein
VLLQRLVAEELFRKQRMTDQARYVEAFRRSAIDPNPHQVEAVAFALERLRYGGALLCNEVGLGKTLESGLVITQLRVEHKARISIIVPLSLARQQVKGSCNTHCARQLALCLSYARRPPTNRPIWRFHGVVWCLGWGDNRCKRGPLGRSHLLERCS